MIPLPMTEFDAQIAEHNRQASDYVNLHSGLQIDWDQLNNITVVMSRSLGLEFTQEIAQYIYSIIGHYRNNTVEDDTIVYQLDDDAYTVGNKTLCNNLTLIAIYVVPLMLYAQKFYELTLEYTTQISNRLPEDIAHLDNFTVSRNLLLTQLQLHYQFLVQCEIEDAIGNEEFRLSDLSDIHIEPENGSADYGP